MPDFTKNVLKAFAALPGAWEVSGRPSGDSERSWQALGAKVELLKEASEEDQPEDRPLDPELEDQIGQDLEPGELLNSEILRRIAWVREAGKGKKSLFDVRGYSQQEYQIRACYVGYEAGFTEQANYKHFKQEYGEYLNSVGGGLGFDFDLGEEEIASSIGQMPDDKWEQFQEDVGVAANYSAVDEALEETLRNEEESRYVKEDFTPDFKREIEDVSWATSYTVWLTANYLNHNAVWDLLRSTETYPEEEGGGGFYLDSEKVLKELDWDDIQTAIQENNPQARTEVAGPRWRALKRAAFDTIAHALRNQTMLYLKNQPERVEALRRASDDQLFDLVCRLVPDDAWNSVSSPCWMVYQDGYVANAPIECVLATSMERRNRHNRYEREHAASRARSMLVLMIADALGSDTAIRRPAPVNHPELNI